jgi:hypothetical protein
LCLCVSIYIYIYIHIYFFVDIFLIIILLLFYYYVTGKHPFIGGKGGINIFKITNNKFYELSNPNYSNALKNLIYSMMHQVNFFFFNLFVYFIYLFQLFILFIYFIYLFLFIVFFLLTGSNEETHSKQNCWL